MTQDGSASAWYIKVRNAEDSASLCSPEQHSKSCAIFPLLPKPSLRRDPSISAGVGGYYRALVQCVE